MVLIPEDTMTRKLVDVEDEEGSTDIGVASSPSSVESDSIALAEEDRRDAGTVSAKLESMEIVGYSPRSMILMAVICLGVAALLTVSVGTGTERSAKTAHHLLQQHKAWPQPFPMPPSLNLLFPPCPEFHSRPLSNLFVCDNMSTACHPVRQENVSATVFAFGLALTLIAWTLF